MRILFLTHFYPPSRIGGTETYTHGLAKELLRIGHRVQVLCAGEWESGKYWNGYSDQIFENVPVRRLNLNWTKAPDVNRYLYDNPVVEHWLENYLNEARPDLVHVTSCNTLSSSIIRAVKRARLPLVVTLTDFWFICPRVTLLRGDNTNCDARVTKWDCLECLLSDSKVYRWSKQVLPPSLLESGLTTISRHGGLTRWPGLRGMAMDVQDRREKLSEALSQANRVLIASESARELFQNSGLTMPIDIVPYGHDLSWLTEYKGKQPSGAVRFGFIGQIAPMKGPQLLIEAFRRSSQEGKARLLIYGDLDKDPAFGRHLRSLAAGRTDIEFRGTYPHEVSGRVFSEMDVLVVPSLWNDYPLICNEAFATGTPVIASDFGGMKEFVQHQVSGLVFERGNPDDLSLQLHRLITEPGLLRRLQAGIPRVKSMQEAADEMTDIYRNVLEPVRARIPVRHRILTPTKGQFIMAKNVLVTGGGGFIGSHLVDALLSKGYKIRVLDALVPQVHGPDAGWPAWVPADVEKVRGDVSDISVWENALAGMDVVYHLAAEVGVGQSMYEITRYMNANTMGTANLLQLLTRASHSIQKVIVASSMSIYGEGAYKTTDGEIVYPQLRTSARLEKKQWEMYNSHSDQPLMPVATDENKPLFPTSIYAISKRDQEEMCLSVGRAYKIPTVALRFFNVYGPRQALSNPYTGVAAIFSGRLLNGKAPLIFEDGGQSRDFVHVKDIVQALVLSMQCEEANYEAINVGTGRQVTIRQVAEALIQNLKVNVEPKINGKFREGDIRHCFADIAKARRLLGYEPTVRFEDGVGDLVGWVRLQNPEDKSEAAAAELAMRGLAH